MWLETGWIGSTGNPKSRFALNTSQQQCNNATTMPAVTTHSTTHRPPLPPQKKKIKGKAVSKKKTKKRSFAKLWCRLCGFLFLIRFGFSYVRFFDHVSTVFCLFFVFLFFFGSLALLASQRCAVAARPLLLLLLGARYKSFQLSLERVTVKTYNLGAEVSSFSIPLFARI